MACSLDGLKFVEIFFEFLLVFLLLQIDNVLGNVWHPIKMMNCSTARRQYILGYFEVIFMSKFNC